MRKIVIFCCCLMTVIIFSESYAQEDILIVTEEWAPYNYMKDGKIVGFSTEIVQQILKITNEDYKIEMVPSMRSTHILNTKPRIIMFSLFRTSERESRYQWIGPLCDGSIFFYKLRDNRLKIESLADIKNVKTIACRHGGLIARLLIEKGFENLDMTATNSLSIYKKLLIGRCDIAISDTDLGMRYYLKSLDTDPDILEKIPIKIFESDLYIACTKDISHKKVEKWQSAFEKLKKNGLYEEIFHRYN